MPPTKELAHDLDKGTRFMGQIYLVRHGQASFGSANYDQLSALGGEQARLLGEWFANCGQRFDRVVTGDLQRHRQTAEACMAVLPKAAQAETEWSIDAGFNEYDHDEVLTRHRPDFADPEAVTRFLAENENGKRAFQQVFEEAVARWTSNEHEAEYRESWSAFQQRCVAALARLTQSTAPSQRIIVFTSGGTIATLCQHLLGMTDRQAFQLNWSLVNSAVTKLLYQSGRERGREGERERLGNISLSYLNNYSHLEWLGEAHSITYR
jgi:broad specificity phosphatase PhoE